MARYIVKSKYSTVSKSFDNLNQARAAAKAMANKYYDTFKVIRVKDNKSQYIAVRNPSKFAKCVSKVSKERGVYDPKGLCASIGRKKYGAKRFEAMAKSGRRRNPVYRYALRGNGRNDKFATKAEASRAFQRLMDRWLDSGKYRGNFPYWIETVKKRRNPEDVEGSENLHLTRDEFLPCEGIRVTEDGIEILEPAGTMSNPGKRKKIQALARKLNARMTKK